MDSFAAANAFAEQLDLKFPLLGDWPKYAVGKTYGVFQEERGVHSRTTFVIDKDGIVRAVVADRDPAGHATGAMAALKTLSPS